jgi:hypothetical protein
LRDTPHTKTQRRVHECTQFFEGRQTRTGPQLTALKRRDRIGGAHRLFDALARDQTIDEARAKGVPGAGGIAADGRTKRRRCQKLAFDVRQCTPGPLSHGHKIASELLMYPLQ